MKKKRTRPPVVMIHGAFCGPWSLENMRAEFTRRGYEVHAPALRFHEDGAVRDAPRALGATSLLDYAADLEAFLDTLDAPPILLGHSLGGLLAQMLAARRDVRAAVLLAPSAPWGVPPSTLFEIAAAQAMFLTGDFWDAVLTPNRDAAFAHSLDKLPRTEREAVFARFTPESGRATFEIMKWGLDMRRAAEVDAAKVTCPLLCISGSDDRINPPGTVARIAALYRGRARLETMEGMSHWLVGEPGWEKVAARALDWLDETLPPETGKKK